MLLNLQARTQSSALAPGLARETLHAGTLAFSLLATARPVQPLSGQPLTSSTQSDLPDRHSKGAAPFTRYPPGVVVLVPLYARSSQHFFSAVEKKSWSLELPAPLLLKFY